MPAVGESVLYYGPAPSNPPSGRAGPPVAPGEYAAIVTSMSESGSIAIIVFPPQQTPFHIQNVPEEWDQVRGGLAPPPSEGGGEETLPGGDGNDTLGGAGYEEPEPPPEEPV